MKSIYISQLLVVLFVVSLIISIATSNHTLETWSSLIAGFALGISLIKLPSIIAWFRKGGSENLQ